jgi:hypothetical protein
MMSVSSAMSRVLALEALLAHFPNPRLVARGIEHRYGERVARALPRQMEQLRAELKRDLRMLKSTNRTKSP